MILEEIVIAHSILNYYCIWDLKYLKLMRSRKIYNKYNNNFYITKISKYHYENDTRPIKL